MNEFSWNDEAHKLLLTSKILKPVHIFYTVTTANS